jgi:PPOX class probable F420-dependent enzyme
MSFGARPSDIGAPVTALSPDAVRLIDGPNFGHLSTLMRDGSPKVEPVWIGRDGDLILVATDAGTIKAQNTASDPRVALSITAAENPYEQLLVRGRVVEVRPDDDLAVLDALSDKYQGRPFGRRRWRQRVVLAIQADLARHYASPLGRSAPHPAGGTP